MREVALMHIAGKIQGQVLSHVLSGPSGKVRLPGHSVWKLLAILYCCLSNNCDKCDHLKTMPT